MPSEGHDKQVPIDRAAGVVVRRWLDVEDRQASLLPIRQVFFDASATRSFASIEERSAFEERWLGRYLTHDAKWFYLAIDPGGVPAGYLAGSIDDPAVTSRFDDIGYFAGLADLTQRFPAHLHINLAPQYRSRGVGAGLIAAFVADLESANVRGVHVVTGRGVRNTRFYAANGFDEFRTFPWKTSELVLLARSLAG